jgi:uncharacterized membrane protein YphA (DoxX/SURF4 family)
MRPPVRAVAATTALLLLAPALASAHERFIRHDLKRRLQEWFFGRDPAGMMGMHPDMFHIGVLVTSLLAVLLAIWFLRESLDHIVRYKVLARLRGPVQRALHNLAAFITDKPVRVGWFYSLGEWSVILFLRAPALVLMYSATNDSLFMPSYPLEPSSAFYFKFLQALLAVLILTQALLPLCGALVLGTWLYLFRWGAFVAADALPVVTVAVVYLTAPWQSHKLAITRLNAGQARWVRIILGFGFLVLGWLKIYNHDLTAGVADNYPWIMNDPLVAMFAAGTDPSLRRETWVVSFGMAEVMSGFMLMTGIFTRFWCCIMLWVFTKLMLVDFGWDEIPHIYPIAALLAVLTSNVLRTEFDLVQKMERGLRDRPLGRVALVAVSSVGIAVVAIFPLLWALTFSDRSMLRQ